MNKLCNTIKEITVEAMYSVTYFVISNLRYGINAISIALPYLMYIMGQFQYEERGKFTVGGELLIPMVVSIVLYYLKEIANRNNKGYRVPIPKERFTEVDEDGEVSVEVNRMQEMLLYVADLEDWLTRKGML